MKIDDEVASYQPEEPKKIIDYAVNRLSRRGKDRGKMSPVYGEPDFLPFQFLELGLRRGSGVCRILIKFSQDGILSIIKEIRESYRNTDNWSHLSISDFFHIFGQQTVKNLEDKFKIKNNSSNDVFLEMIKSDNVCQELALEVSKNVEVCPIATGFLVSRNHILTVSHIFPKLDLQSFPNKNESSVKQVDFSFFGDYIAQFGYEQDLLGREIQPVEYKIKRLLSHHKKLDYALLELEEKPVKFQQYSSHVGLAGDTFGWIPMSLDETTISSSLDAHQDPKRFVLLDDDELTGSLKANLNKLSISDPQIIGILSTSYESEKIQNIIDNSTLALLKIKFELERKIKKKNNHNSDNTLNSYKEEYEKIQVINKILELDKKNLLDEKNIEFDEERFKTIRMEIIKDIIKERSKHGEPVTIIQHPQGRRKEIIVSNNRTLLMFQDYLFYEADADLSSSGSPVFNQEWQLVALHSKAITPSITQIGVRVCRIVKDVIDKALFLEESNEDISDQTPEFFELTRFVNIFLGEDKKNLKETPFEEQDRVYRQYGQASPPLNFY
ncbi:MAG: trypsin-like peptidase domain-containing protein [Limnoraphis sp. WC205]|nr:trypsin-like peptidase domain-containing protein [Limnoraphis sp. WC205]